MDIRSRHYMSCHYSNMKQEEVNSTGIPEDFHHDLQQGKMNDEDTLDQLHQEQKEIDPQEFCDYLNGEMKQEKADPQEIMLRKICPKEDTEDFPEESDDDWEECRWEDLLEEKIIAQDARSNFNQEQEEMDREDFRDHLNEEQNQEKVDPPEAFDVLQEEKKIEKFDLLKGFDLPNEETKKIKGAMKILSRHYMGNYYSNLKQEEVNHTGIPEDLHDLQQEKMNAEDALDQEQDDIDPHEFCDNLNEEIKQEKVDLKEMFLRRIFLPEPKDEDWELSSNLSAEHNSKEKTSYKDIILIIFMVFLVIVYFDLKLSQDPKYRKDALSSSLATVNDTELIRHVMVHLWSTDSGDERIQNQSANFLISKLNATNLEILSNLAMFSKDKSLLQAIDAHKMNEIRKTNWYRNLKAIVTWVKRTYHQEI